MTDTSGTTDEKKLLPESSRSDDEQILWLAFSVLAVLGLLIFGISRCGSASDLADNFSFGSSNDDESSIQVSLDGDGDLSSSAEFFTLGDSADDLADESAGPFTVFAPTNDSWEAALTDAGLGSPGDFLDDISDDDATEGAGFHIVEGEYSLDELIGEGTVTTIDGYELSFDKDGLINGSVTVEDADISSSNGVVHAISSVLPSRPPVAAEPAATAEPEPEPEAAPEPTAVPTAEPTAVPEPTAAPEPTPTPEPEPTPEPTPAPAVTIADLAGETPDLSQLTALVGALGLDTTLADPSAGPFTVFAPTNDAFDENSELLGQLLDGEVESVVGYHVVPGLVSASDIVPGARFETLTGDTLVINSNGDLPGNVNVLSADLRVDNGIVHVVDSILVPARITLRTLTSNIATLEGIQFDVGSATIRAESEPILVQAAATLRLLPESTLVEVGGHTDSDGGAEGNQALSEARANSVVAYLVAEGVDADVLTAVGYGEDRLLVDPEATDADKQANRRIEFTNPDS